MLTYEELERAAYISGNMALADAMHAAATLERIEDDLPYGFDFDTPLDDQIEKRVEEETAKNCPDYAEYREFFYDCFQRLDGHYPCPSVTSDYDKSIILAAIEKGEAE